MPLGVQGFISGSGGTTKHHKQATGQSVETDPDIRDEHLGEGQGEDYNVNFVNPMGGFQLKAGGEVRPSNAP